MRVLFDTKGESRPSAIEKADHGDAYTQQPLLRGDELAAVVTARNPADVLWRRFASRAELFGSAEAVLHNNRVSHAIASLACRILEIPTRRIL